MTRRTDLTPLAILVWALMLGLLTYWYVSRAIADERAWQNNCTALEKQAAEARRRR